MRITIFKPVLTLLILVLLGAAFFTHTSGVGAHPDPGTDWVNDWLRIKVQNNTGSDIEGVVLVIFDIEHTTGHGHWPGKYQINIGCFSGKSQF